MILLQAGGDIFRSANPSTSMLYYFGFALLGVVALILIGAMLSRRRAPRTDAEIQQYSSGVFRRAAKAMGLPGPHIEVLQNLVRACKLKQPMLVFSSAGLLDDTLKKGLYSLDSARELSEAERESRKAIIFQIKQIIERNAKKRASVQSTTLLRPGQVLTVTPEGGGAFSSRVVSNMKDFLTVSAPTQPAGADTRWMRGTPLAVYLWRENDAGYSFVSKVLGYDTVKGVRSVLIQHSRTLRREQRRKSRRKELMRPCFFYPIRIAEAGDRRQERKAIVEQNMRTLGTVVDLSAGGCAIQTLNPFDKGRLVMIEFDIDKKAPIRSFGKVQHVHRQKGRGGSMHVMFTRVTRQHLNRISEFVYDFTRTAGTPGIVRTAADRPAPGRA
jgi:hypothetical protein